MEEINIIRIAIKLGYEKHSGFTSKKLSEQPLISVYKQIEYFLIQKWLREKHEIAIEITSAMSSNIEYYYGIVNHRDSQYHKDRFGVKNYEDALEQGLQEALKLLK